MSSNFDFRIFFVILWVKSVLSMSQANKHSYFMDSSASDSEFADLIISKGYLPSEQELPKPSVVANVDNDATYLLSKLSDEDLIKLLNDQPKKNVYDLKDIVKVAVESKSLPENKLMINVGRSKPRDDLDIFLGANNKGKRFKTVSEGDKSQSALFRLDDKPVDPYSMKSDAQPNYVALQKLNNLLYSRPLEEVQEKSAEEEEKKELLFDALVSQLKTLCCKSTKSTKKREEKKMQYKSVLDQLIPKTNNIYKDFKSSGTQLQSPSNEHMFLVINDEIKSNGSEELISVDPESLETNSSVLLLGPITSPLSNSQLQKVMMRISKELSKPEYLPLLQQLSEGNLKGKNIRLMKNLISGPDARRYIKPHRCNHQSPLAKVYGGPKWLICTGYLNINTPSLYDK